LRPAAHWRYKLAYWTFALAMIFLAGNTVVGVFSWLINWSTGSGSSITTDYTPTKAPGSDYDWPH
jgi:hypothetical protein